MSNLWWHNIPQHSVGDLVQIKDPFLKQYQGQLCIVVEAKPAKACRVNPVQKIRTVRCSDGFKASRWWDAKRWEKVCV